MSITINTLTYTHPDRELLFQHLSISISDGQKASLVGHNGAGKSTLLRIIAEELVSSSGVVRTSAVPYYVPQHLGQYDDYTISRILGVEDKIKALQAILNGNVDEENFNLLNDDWEIEERIKSILTSWRIEYLNLNQPLRSLSEGEKTKVFLAGISIHTPEVILLDEPSNHLDTEGRELLYDFVRQSKSTLLVVSHDRELLNLLDITLELSSDNIEVYGGNYDFYKNQKEIKSQALQTRLEDQEKNLKQVRQRAREIAEQQQKKAAGGKARAGKLAQARIIAGSMQSKAEQSTAKRKSEQSEKMDELSGRIGDIRQQIQEQKLLKFDWQSSELHQNKILIDVQQINCSYGDRPLWPFLLTFQIRSGERIRIEGGNGVGKSSLIRILCGELQASQGSVYRADFRCLYLDQQYSMINTQLTVLEQVGQFNDRKLQEYELKTLLHYHQFPRETWDKKCALLSGGEKMKLALCCAAVSDNVPDLLVLDEPTNNLDLYSLEILTEAVKSYKGTLLLVSHDSCFVNEIGIDKKIVLE